MSVGRGSRAPGAHRRRLKVLLELVHGGVGQGDVLEHPFKLARELAATLRLEETHGKRTEEHRLSIHVQYACAYCGLKCTCTCTNHVAQDSYR